MKPEPVNCWCGGRVSVRATSGGRGSRDLTSYGAECFGKCKSIVADNMGDDGRRITAIREWNRLRRENPEMPDADTRGISSRHTPILGASRRDK